MAVLVVWWAIWSSLQKLILAAGSSKLQRRLLLGKGPVPPIGAAACGLGCVYTPQPPAPCCRR